MKMRKKEAIDLACTAPNLGQSYHDATAAIKKQFLASSLNKNR
jgi:hypothetical protein